MALIIDTSVGGETANSYASVAVADAYFEAQPEFKTLWDALTDEQQKAHLIEATRAIDRFEYLYASVTTTQALKFPLECQDDTTEIPTKVIHATLEMLRYRFHNRDATTGQASRDVDMVNVPGKIQVQFSKEVSSTVNQATGGNLETVKALLREWRAGDNNFRIVK